MKRTSVKTASAQPDNPQTAASDYGPSTLMSRPEAVSTRIHLARRTGKLTGQEHLRRRDDYAQVCSNIDHAHNRFGREIPDGRVWARVATVDSTRKRAPSCGALPNRYG